MSLTASVSCSLLSLRRNTVFETTPCSVVPNGGTNNLSGEIHPPIDSRLLKGLVENKIIDKSFQYKWTKMNATHIGY